MDGRVYNYNTGPWNACNENFQAACLELQNNGGVPVSRETAHSMVRDPSKAMASATPFMFLNYPTAEDHLHQSNQHAMHRAAAAAQWHMPQWQKMKAHASHTSHKNIGMMKDDWSGMTTNMHPGHPLFNIPPPGPFCTADMTTDTIPDSSTAAIAHQQQHQLLQQNAGLSFVNERTPTIVESHQQVQSTPPKPPAKKSNPQPKKKREKKKTDKEKKKRTRNEESWARNKRKKARARGESYMSVVGKMMRAKEVQPVDCSKCKFHCPDHVSEEDRQKLFNDYWGRETFKDKVNFLSDCVEEFVPLRPISGKRLYSRRYKLKIGEGDDERIARVCKEFFISTFDISESTIVTFMNKKRKNPEEIKDNRGHQIPSNKTPPEVMQSIREHILSQTGLQGCLTKFQLEEVRNMKRLYTHYHKECEYEDKKPASMSVYRKVYGDMHKDRTEAPVIMPPEDLLDSITTKKSKQTKDDSPPETEKSPNEEAVEDDFDDDDDEDSDDGCDDDHDDDDDDNAAEPLSTERLNLTPPIIPQQQHLTPSQQAVVSSTSSSSSSCSMVVRPGNSSSNDINNITSHQQHQPLPHPHPNNNPLSRQISDEKLFGLNIPMSSLPHSQNLLDNVSGQMQMTPAVDNTIIAPSFDTAGAHINQLMPLMWGTHRIAQQSNIPNSSHQTTDMSATGFSRGIHSSFNTGPATFPTNLNPNSNPNLNLNNNINHMTNQSCLFGNANTALGSITSSSSLSAVISHQTNPSAYTAAAAASALSCMPDPTLAMAIPADEEVVVVKKLKKPPRPRNKPKSKKEVKKRTRNEESWGRNIRKRLRFKGEEYISVKGKTVGAKNVQKVNCSKCKYKCTSKITEEHREVMNEEYWKLDNYEKRIAFISKYVQTYVPKRKMTGRRAYSRNYTFIKDGKHIRVCKNFFVSTLHISESIVATCLKKARKGPSASKDMRGKHKPVNKTPEEVLQNIRELIIYLTGVRPKRKRAGSEKAVAEEYQDINRLYLIYKYDSEKKGKKIASHGIFRNVLLNEFGFTGNSKFKKSLINKTNAMLSKSNAGVISKSKTDCNDAAGAQTETGTSTEQTKDNMSATNTKTEQSTASSSTSQPVVSGSSSNGKQPEAMEVELSEGSSTHPVFSTCLLSSF